MDTLVLMLTLSTIGMGVLVYLFLRPYRPDEQDSQSPGFAVSLNLLMWGHPDGKYEVVGIEMPIESDRDIDLAKVIDAVKECTLPGEAQ